MSAYSLKLPCCLSRSKQCFCILNGRLDLPAVAHQPRIVGESIDIFGREISHTLRIKVKQGLASAGPFRVDDFPADARLEDGLAEDVEIVGQTIGNDLLGRVHFWNLPFSRSYVRRRRGRCEVSCAKKASSLARLDLGHCATM
jgi:hypothetical protein